MFECAGLWDCKEGLWSAESRETNKEKELKSPRDEYNDINFGNF